LEAVGASSDFLEHPVNNSAAKAAPARPQFRRDVDGMDVYSGAQPANKEDFIDSGDRRKGARHLQRASASHFADFPLR
jgi:hypothetical protein